MRIFVTGAGGFVGAHLLTALRRRHWQPCASDREVDVCDPEQLAAALRHARPEAIVHLAAVSSVTDSGRDPGAAYRVNFLGTRNLLEAALRCAPRARILWVGSGEIYGGEPPPAGHDERCALRPRSPYAWTKAAADRLAAHYAERGLDVVRVRPFNHSGAGQSDRFVLASFARQAVEASLGRRHCIEVGNLDCVRDFLAVEDVVEAYCRLVDDAAATGCYNVASGRGLRLGDALARLLGCAGARAELRIDPQRLRPTDRSLGDAGRLRAETGWSPRISLETLFERLIEDWRKRLEPA